MASSPSLAASAGIASAALTTRSGAVSSTVTTAATTDMGTRPIFPRPGDQMAGLLLGLVQLVPRVLYWIVTFVTIVLPTTLFSLFSTSLTITMNATTLLLLALLVVSTVSWFVRYRYQTMYSRLPPEPQRKQPNVELFTDLPDGDSKRGISNYLDEFLSAIKVFGYLERPVFHELTRTMQTKKLIAGETIKLEEEQGFCLVVDGLVQIFVKSQANLRSGREDYDDDESTSGESNQGYQLLTEVKNGAPLSSLFSILSLFTEDVKLRYDDDDDESAFRPPSAGFARAMPSGNITPAFGAIRTPTSERDGAMSGSASPKIQRRVTPGSLATMGNPLPSVPPLSLDPENSDSAQKETERGKSHARLHPESAHPDIVARASVDTTIAIIPATAFRRLTRVYPKASSHIVQVILTRLQRVTLTTGHAYLGLTSEVLRTERLMNRYTTYDLPGVLRGSALDRLKEKFSQERQRNNPENGSKGIALHNPRAQQRRRSSVGLRRDAAAHVRLTSRASQHQRGTPLEKAPSFDDRESVSAGDLLSNLSEVPRGSGKHDRRERFSVSQPFQTMSGDLNGPSERAAAYVAAARESFQNHRQESLDEGAFYRTSIVDCMLKAIGLTNAKGAIKAGHSVEQSPRLVSYDSKRQKAIFNNAFGFMDALDPYADAESESITSVPTSTISVDGSASIQEQLTNDVEIVFFPKGSVLVEQGERNPGLYYVIDGFLDVSVPEDDAEHRQVDPLGQTPFSKDPPLSPPAHFTRRTSTSPFASPHSVNRDRRTRRAPTGKSLHLTKPGGLAGYLGTISSRRSFVDVVAKTDVYVGFLPRAAIERIVDKYPIVLLTMAKRLTSLLPRLILHIDFALEWIQVDAGQALYRQGDESDAIYIVLNGRLRSLHDDGNEGKMRVIGEYGQGDSVGELEVLTESRRPGSLHAIRDTEVAKLPKTLFNTLALENPEITIKISRIIAARMRDLTEGVGIESHHHKTAKSIAGLTSSTMNLRTVAVLPVTNGVPVVEFASRLLSALTQIGTPNGATSLNQAAILNHLGRHAFNRMGKLKLSQHLADLEEKYGLVLYVADTNVNSPWTQTCISQADCILLVGVAEGSPSIGDFERLLLTTKTTARKELVLLHAERYCTPGVTRKWLKNRTWVNGSHHHVHMAFRHSNEPVLPQTKRFGTALKQRVQILQAEIQKFTSRRVRQTPLYSADSPFKGDFHRLARRLIGKSVGLVLGGGGARGISHIGIIRALEEAGIPIDIVGGTSIGAFVGALYAWDADMVPMYGRAKRFSGRMGSMWRFALDLTYPSASYTTGHEFNRGLFKTFGTAQIEDFWLEFYCNSTNISKSRTEIHTSGYVWRYVRASMTLAGLVPPLCDEGNMLVDGGYMDNLTVEHMRNLGADVIFAVDVGAVDDESPQVYGDSLSGFWAAFNRWNPFSSHVNPPTLGEIQARLAYVSSVDALERAKTLPGCRYMRPPVLDYATLDFGRFDEIYKVGYEYGKRYLEQLRQEGVLPVMEESDKERQLRRTMAPRRASI